ncbi:hypothetical protein ACWDKQ_12880 [Saccharopolyspora sp. NPDC000995]
MLPDAFRDVVPLHRPAFAYAQAVHNPQPTAATATTCTLRFAPSP